LARAFYARQDTRTPVIIAVISLLSNIGLALWFRQIFIDNGVYALALSFSISSVLNAVLLYIFIKIKVGWLDDKKTIISLSKISFASLVMGIVVWVMLRGALVLPIPEHETFIKIFTQAFLAGGVGVIVYVGLAFLMRADELEMLRAKVKEGWSLIRRK
jgi:putative peptidoglycan lipid II flippase